MQYPNLLTPTTTENIELSSGQIVQIPKANPLFKMWGGKPVSDTYGNKLVLSFNGKPAFAELAILGILQDDGWYGVWVDTYSNKYRTSYWPKDEVELPSEWQKLLHEIYQKAGSNKGCYDVFCWKEALVSLRNQRDKGMIRSETLNGDGLKQLSNTVCHLHHFCLLSGR